MALSGHPDTLAPQQARFFAALLTEPTVGAAARRAGCGERTALRWLKDPAFAAAYREARRASLTHATAQLQAACTEAMATLRELLRSDLAEVRLGAARAILELALRAGNEDDLEERIAAIEAYLAERAPPPARNGWRPW